MRRLIGVGLITLLGMLAGACKSHDQLVVDTVCNTMCPCVDPEFVDQCLQQCRFELDPRDVSQECFDCMLDVQGEACFEVERCEAVCEASEPDDTDGGPPFLVDAPIVIDKGVPP